jgi:dipeptidyl aminopeptidase/acylaminoacyl peptidase
MRAAMEYAPLVTSASASAFPAWTPGGDQFAYVVRQARQSEIWIRAGQGWPRRVLDGTEFSGGKTLALSDVSLSGDGQRVVFTRVASDGHHIWIAPLSGDRPVRAVLGRTAFEESPAWSPDNSTVAFLALASGVWKLAAAAPGSGEVTFLADAARVAPAWSPDSTSLAFALPDGKLAVTQRDGSGLRTVGDGRWLVCAWSRDGKAIVRLKLNADGHLVLGSVQPDSGLDQTLSDLGPRPPMIAIAEAVGMRPFIGGAVTPEGNALEAGQLSGVAEIWMASMR